MHNHQRQLRPTRDLKETLLHELVHAYCFVHNLRDSDPGGHGEPFQRKMREINQSTCADSQRPPGGYNITVCHSMHDEVRSYQTHVWNCSKCGNEVRRAMNRRPQPADCRGRMGDACADPHCMWHMHLRMCGGEYVKVRWLCEDGVETHTQSQVSEPPPKKRAAAASSNQAPKRQRLPQNRPITAFFPPAGRDSLREVLAAAAERRAAGSSGGIDFIDLT